MEAPAFRVTAGLETASLPTPIPTTPPALVEPTMEAFSQRVTVGAVMTPVPPLTPTIPPTLSPVLSSLPAKSSVRFSTVPLFTAAKAPTLPLPETLVASRHRFFSTAPAPTFRKRPALSAVVIRRPSIHFPLPSSVPRKAVSMGSHWSIWRLKAFPTCMVLPMKFKGKGKSLFSAVSLPLASMTSPARSASSETVNVIAAGSSVYQRIS